MSGIWALSTEAGHRSHEGANADSALVDWLGPCSPPPPKSIPPDIIITIRLSSIPNFFDAPFSTPSCASSSNCTCLSAGAMAGFGGGGGGGGAVGGVLFGTAARTASNEAQPLPNTFHMLTSPWTSLSWLAWPGANANNRRQRKRLRMWPGEPLGRGGGRGGGMQSTSLDLAFE